MRGLKAKTMRRVARATQLPPLVYLTRVHYKLYDNPKFVPGGDEPQQITVHRLQRVLGNCQRRALQKMKKLCPKNAFFLGMSLREFRRGEPGLAGMEIVPVAAPQPEAVDAAA